MRKWKYLSIIDDRCLGAAAADAMWNEWVQALQDPSGAENLSGHFKTGHAWSLQNRPYEMARDVNLFYPAFS